MQTRPVFAAAVISLAALAAATAESPNDITVPGGTLVATVHAVGSQVYECKADPAVGTLTWQFREPVATLFIAGKTVGRHFAGPSWELVDGSSVQGKVIARAPAASDKDIPWLKLSASARRGEGRLSDVSVIQRINTRGGVAEGICNEAGAFLSVPYSADYTFFNKTNAQQ